MYDPRFDLSRADAQAAFVGLCEALRAEVCGEPTVCSRPPYPSTLASLGSVRCFLEALRDDSGGVLPVGPAFTPAVAAWLETPGARSYRDDVGLVGGTVRWARIRSVYTVLDPQPVAKLRLLYDRTARFLDERFFPSAPPSLRTAVFDSGDKFVWMTTSEQLVTVILQGFAIIFPCAPPSSLGSTFPRPL